MRLLPFLVGGALLCACEQAPPITQPIDFNHRAHIEKGLPCEACHESIQTAAAAGMPTTERCMMCHQGAITDSPEEEKVRQYAEQGMQIPWRRLYEAPGHVYFSHRRHVALGGIECAECHGGIAQSSAPLPRAAIAITMDTCMDCHWEQGADNDCNACHR